MTQLRLISLPVSSLVPGAKVQRPLTLVGLGKVSTMAGPFRLKLYRQRTPLPSRTMKCVPREWVHPWVRLPLERGPPFLDPVLRIIRGPLLPFKSKKLTNLPPVPLRLPLSVVRLALASPIPGLRMTPVDFLGSLKNC